MMGRFSQLVCPTMARLFARGIRRYTKVPLILMYHRIANAPIDPWKLAVPPDVFDQQLEVLKDSRRVLSLLEFGRLHQSGQLPRNAIAITLDDGYACNALVAAPLLERHGLPATVFVTTGVISSNEEFWWDSLLRVVGESCTDSLRISVGGEVVSVFLGRQGTNFESAWNALIPAKTARASAYFELWRKLRVVGDKERRGVMSALYDQAGLSAAARADYRAMTAAEIRKIAASGLITIGAHSVTHPVLSGLSRNEQVEEIRGSFDACADVIGRPPRAFAYPYGEYSEETISVVNDAGYEIACAAHPFGVSSHSRTFRMPRVAVGVWTASELRSAMGNVDQEGD